MALLADMSLSNADLVIALGRSMAAVRCKRCDLPGYHKRSTPMYWTKEQLAMLDESLTDAQIAQAAGRTIPAVRHMRKRRNGK